MSNQFLMFHCAFCNAPIVEGKERRRRSDARYCSSACRQAAYRKRVAAGTAVQTLEYDLGLIVEQFYTNCSDERTRQDCRDYMRAFIKSAKQSMAVMGLDMTYQIKG